VLLLLVLLVLLVLLLVLLLLVLLVVPVVPVVPVVLLVVLLVVPVAEKLVGHYSSSIEAEKQDDINQSQDQEYTPKVCLVVREMGCE
jgi:membrane protein required for beta-lactamase induction